MKTYWRCPACNEALCFDGPEQILDFCPVHFEPLQPVADGGEPGNATPDSCREDKVPGQSESSSVDPGSVAPLMEVRNPVAQQDVGGENSEQQVSPDPSLLRQALNKLKDRLNPGKAADADRNDAILPDQARRDGWRLDGNHTTAPGYDSWPIQREIGNGVEHATYIRYRTTVFTPPGVYDILSESLCTGCVKLLAHGTVETGAGARAQYEISQPASGEPLRAWLSRTPVGADRATILLGLLVDLLASLRDATVRPMVLTPAMLWLDKDGLRVGMHGAMASVSASDTITFVSELSGNPLLALPYTAPECIERRVIGHNSELFSLGQLVAEALWGEPQDHAYVRQGNVPFAQSSDQNLSRVLMGTLWPFQEQRWTLDDLVNATREGNPSLAACPPWASLRPGAATSSFSLAGVDYYLPEDLALAVFDHWDEALANLQAIISWLEQTRFSSLPPVLRSKMLEEHRSDEWILVYLCRSILPGSPMVWRDLALDDGHAQSSLAALAQRALSQDSDARSAQQLVAKLFEADLRGAFKGSSGGNPREGNP